MCLPGMILYTFNHLTQNKMEILELKKRVEELVKEVESTHRYSMSRIYGLYNEVFETQEKPQSCASCLMRKVRELKLWLENQKPEELLPAEEETTVKPETEMAANTLPANPEPESPAEPVKKKRKYGTKKK